MSTNGDGRAVGEGPFPALEAPRARIFAVVFALVMAGTVFGKAGHFALLGDARPPLDFEVFWGAGRLLVEGRPLDVFDQALLGAAYGRAETAWLPWVYGPAVLLLVAPLGLLPFWTAWSAMAVVSLAALAAAVRHFAEGRWTAVALIAAAPAFLPAVQVGQWTLLWAAGLLAALAALRGGRAALAGVLLGLLTLKPQLGLLIPVALLAAGQWRAVAVAALTAAALALLPLAATGTGYWPELLKTMAVHSEIVAGAVADLPRLAGPSAALAGAGLPPALAWGLTALLALAVWIVWRRPGHGDDAKAAVLVAALPLATPYLWWYDTGLLAVTALFLVRAGGLPRRAGGQALLALALLGALPALVLEETLGTAAPITRAWTLTLMSLLLLWALWVTFRPGALVSAPRAP